MVWLHYSMYLCRCTVVYIHVSVSCLFLYFCPPVYVVVHEVVTRAKQMFPNVIFTGVTNERDVLSSIQALDKEQFPKYAGTNDISTK